MDRRLVIALTILVMAVLALLLVQMSSAMTADGTTQARPAEMPGAVALGGAAAVDLRRPSPMSAPEVATGLMSGDYTVRHLA